MALKQSNRFVLSFLIILLLCSISFAQSTFARKIRNSGTPAAMIATRDGGTLLISGIETRRGPASILVQKVNRSGQSVWQKELLSSQRLRAGSVAQLPNGNYVLTGGRVSGEVCCGHLESMILGLSATGQIRFQKDFDESGSSRFSSSLSSVVTTPEGGIVAAGPNAPDPFQSGNVGVTVVRLSSRNEILWAKVFSSNSVRFAAYSHLTLLKTSDQALIVALQIADNDSLGEIGAVVLKLDTAGNLLWKRFLRRNDFRLESAAATSTGGSMLAFSSIGDLFLVRLNSNGAVIWRKRYRVASTSSIDFPLTQNADGGFAVAGSVDSPLNAGFIAKFDSAGKILFDTLFDTNLSDNPAFILQTSDSGHVVFGSRFGQTEDLFLLKLDSNANVPGCGLFRPVTTRAAGFGSLNISNPTIQTKNWTPRPLIPDISSRNVQRSDSKLCP